MLFCIANWDRNFIFVENADSAKLDTPVPIRTLKLGNFEFGPRLALGWVTIQGLDVDNVATNTVKCMAGMQIL